MTDSKWAVLINFLAATGILISFFVYEPYLYVRIVILTFAMTEPLLLLYRNKFKNIRLWFWMYCSLILFGVVFSLTLDNEVIITENTLYIFVFVIILLISTYKSLFKPNNLNEN